MSKFRVELDVAFDNETDAIAFINLVEDIKDKFYKGSAGDGIAVIKRCRYHECFHDENPPKQCGDYVHIDIDDAVVTEHKASDGKVYIGGTLNTTEKV
jgi:hypothetical protein